MDSKKVNTRQDFDAQAVPWEEIPVVTRADLQEYDVTEEVMPACVFPSCQTSHVSATRCVRCGHQGNKECVTGMVPKERESEFLRHHADETWVCPVCCWLLDARQLHLVQKAEEEPGAMVDKTAREGVARMEAKLDSVLAQLAKDGRIKSDGHGHANTSPMGTKTSDGGRAKPDGHGQQRSNPDGAKTMSDGHEEKPLEGWPPAREDDFDVRRVATWGALIGNPTGRAEIRRDLLEFVKYSEVPRESTAPGGAVLHEMRFLCGLLKSILKSKQDFIPPLVHYHDIVTRLVALAYGRAYGLAAQQHYENRMAGVSPATLTKAMVNSIVGTAVEEGRKEEYAREQMRETYRMKRETERLSVGRLSGGGGQGKAGKRPRNSM